MDGAEAGGDEDGTAGLEALARDWIALWQSELAALIADPETVEGMARLFALWLGLAAAGLGAAPRAPGHEPHPARADAPPRAAAGRPAPDAGGVAGDGGGGGDSLRPLLDRLDAIERRLAALEVARGRRPGGGDRAAPRRRRPTAS